MPDICLIKRFAATLTDEEETGMKGERGGARELEVGTWKGGGAGGAEAAMGIRRWTALLNQRISRTHGAQGVVHPNSLMRKKSTIWKVLYSWDAFHNPSGREPMDNFCKGEVSPERILESSYKLFVSHIQNGPIRFLQDQWSHLVRPWWGLIGVRGFSVVPWSSLNEEMCQ